MALSHSVTDATQGNGNGVVGRIELRATPTARIRQLGIVPEAATGKVSLVIHTEGLPAGAKASGTVRVRGISSTPRDEAFGNRWDLFVYPTDEPEEPAGVAVHHSLGAALDDLAAGKPVLWLPQVATIRNDPARPLIAGFSPIFWNYSFPTCCAPRTKVSGSMSHFGHCARKRHGLL